MVCDPLLRLGGAGEARNSDDDVLLPPPAEYPLHTRPRAAEYVCQLMHSNWSVPSHVIPGPPYSLMVVEDPDARNTFSYGFGPDGAGGIIVFSGFIDDFLSKNKSAAAAPPAGSPNGGSGSGSSGMLLWSRLVPLITCLCVFVCMASRSPSSPKLPTTTSHHLFVPILHHTLIPLSWASPLRFSERVMPPTLASGHPSVPPCKTTQRRR